jgi:predicted Zn-dependent protease with MMP-like domain
MRRSERERFDRLFEEVYESLPPGLLARLEEVPVVLEDHPSPELLRSMGMDPQEDDLCGLHSGVPLTHRSVEHQSLEDVITLFREGILDEAGGWEEWTDDDGTPLGGEERVREEIRITLLHEIGHHFGLDEEDLERLGYA